MNGVRLSFLAFLLNWVIKVWKGDAEFAPSRWTGEGWPLPDGGWRTL
jgi:hypothetical protein